MNPNTRIVILGTDLVRDSALAMQVGATSSDFAHMIYVYPTLAEGMMEGAEGVEGLAFHQARKRT